MKSELGRFLRTHRSYLIILLFITLVTGLAALFILKQQQNELNREKIDLANSVTENLEIQLNLIEHSYRYLLGQINSTIAFHNTRNISQALFESLTEYDTHPFRNFVQNIRFSPIVLNGERESYNTFANAYIVPNFTIRAITPNFQPLPLDDYFLGHPFYIPASNIDPIALLQRIGLIGVDMLNITDINRFFHKFTEIDHIDSSSGIRFVQSRDFEDLGIFFGQPVGRPIDCRNVSADSLEELIELNLGTNCLLGFAYLPLFARDYINAAISLFDDSIFGGLINDIEFMIWDRRSNTPIYRPLSIPRPSDPSQIDTQHIVTTTPILDDIDLYLVFGSSLTDDTVEKRIESIYIITPLIYFLVVIIVTVIYYLTHRTHRILAEKNLEYDTMITYTNHETRDPLQAILSHVDFSHHLLSKITKSDRVPSLEELHQLKQYLRVIRQAAISLRIIANDILELQKIEHGSLTITYRHVTLGWIEQRLSDAMVPYIADNPQIDFRTSFPTPNESLYVDPNRLTQILTNFLSNAFKNTDQGVIEIGTEHDKHTITFYVSDTGSGILPRIAQVIFTEKFIENPKSETKGIGIGMFIVGKLTKMMGGSVRFKTEVGAGSTFYLTIPRPKVVEIQPT